MAASLDCLCSQSRKLEIQMLVHWALDLHLRMNLREWASGFHAGVTTYPFSLSGHCHAFSQAALCGNGASKSMPLHYVSRPMPLQCIWIPCTQTRGRWDNKKVIQYWGDWFSVIFLPLWLLQETPGVLWWYTVSFLLALALP